MTKKEVKKVDDIEAFRIALSMCLISVDNQAAELIMEIYEGFKKKGDAFSIADVSKIKASLIKKYSKVSVTAKRKP